MNCVYYYLNLILLWLCKEILFWIIEKLVVKSKILIFNDNVEVIVYFDV